MMGNGEERHRKPTPPPRDATASGPYIGLADVQAEAGIVAPTGTRYIGSLQLGGGRGRG
jgi:hypothetical protein